MHFDLCRKFVTDKMRDFSAASQFTYTVTS